jgi:ABC-type lipoprotein release transport system permease subunit
MLIALAWKNVWRNKKRSLIIATAIALGLWGGLLSSGLMIGLTEAYVNSAIDRDLSHIQLHTSRFKEDKLLNDIIPSADSIAEHIRRIPGVKEATPRTIIMGIAASPVTSNAVKISGIIPELERKITSIPRCITQGVPLDSATRLPIFIGEELAMRLELRLRSKLVLSFQGVDGTIIYGAFRVCGIYRSESSMFDMMNVFVRRDDLFSLLGSQPLSHEIAVRLITTETLDSTVSMLKASNPGLLVESWKDLALEIKLFNEMIIIEVNIWLGIVLFALLFGVTNTMLMSVLDRVREFGILSAIGMKRWRLFGLIIVETIILASTGGIVGMILGGASVLYFGSAGIDLVWFAKGMTYFGMPTILYPVLPLWLYLSLTVMLIVTAIIAAIYPGIKAVRLNPATAIRTIG